MIFFNLPIFHVMVLTIFAFAYFKAGDMESPDSRCHIYWPFTSIATFMLSWMFLTTSLPFLILIQFALGIVIALFRTQFEPKPPA